MRRFGLIFFMISSLHAFASSPEKKDSPPPAESSKAIKINEGGLRLKLEATKKLIASDQSKLEKAQKLYDHYNTYDGDPRANKRQAIKLKQEIKTLKKRIATHEYMVKTWESSIIEITGKTPESS